MPIQFPSNPSLNQEYTYEGKVWRWDGVSWVGVRQETGIAEEKVWSKYLLQNPNRGTRLNSGYSYVTDQRRTRAGTIAASKHFMERSLGVWDSIVFSPLNLIPSLWLDASDASTITLSGNEVVSWSDKSGNGLGCSQGTSANRPIKVSTEQNSLDVIRFVASDYLSSSGNLDLTTAYTIFIVAKNRIRKNYNGLIRIGALALSNDISDLEIYWQEGTDGNKSGNIVTVGNRGINFKGDQTDNAPPAVNNYYIHSAQVTGSGFATRYINGSVQTSTQTFGTGVVVPLSANRYHVGIGYPANGNAPSACLDGDICEIVALHYIASTDERQKMEGYLAHKWGLTNSLPADHPYKNAAP